jgi:hypothetical protein
MPEIQPYFKAGLLLCQPGFNIERGRDNRYDSIQFRTMFLILCEAGIKHYEDRDSKWVEYHENMIPGNYIYLAWNRDHLFTTANGTSIQLKVVDARPDAGQKPVYKRSRSDVGPASANRDGGPASAAKPDVIVIQDLLLQMKLASNAL